MPTTTKDLLGRNPDQRIKIILLHAAHPEGLAVVDVVFELGVDNKKRTGLVDNHLDPLVEAGVLEEYSVTPKHSKQKRQTKKNGYRMKDEISTLQILANTDKLCCETLKSAYYVTMVDPVCGHFSGNLSTAGLPKLTEVETKCLKLVLKSSKSCLLFVVNKTPSELKTMVKEYEDRNDRQKKTINRLVGAMIDNPGAIDGLLQWVMQMLHPAPHQIAAAMSKPNRRKLRNITIPVMELLVIPPLSWQTFFFDMMKIDQAMYDSHWSTEDENSVIELVIDSLGSSLPKGA